MKPGIFIAIVFSFLFHDCLSESYALLIGINNYYKKEKGKIVKDSSNTLHGCVNDAKSIKKLITTKFGFKPANVRELYDSVATKKRILKEVNALLSKCKPGDVAFIYYSGHGMTFQYGPNSTQTSEVICPSDIFTSVNFLQDSSYDYSFIETSQLAALFNKFVDKKITLTTIFDCCYSNGTVGVKKTINTKTLVNGIQMINKRDFWYEEVEMQLSTQVRRGNGLMDLLPFDNKISACDVKRVKVLFDEWLLNSGYAQMRALCDSIVISCTNNYDEKNWKPGCGNTASIVVLFSVKDNCENTDTSSATFTIVDEEKPGMVIRARDTLLACCGSNPQLALSDWLASNGGAMAKDTCSEITWSNNFTTLKSGLDSTGSALVTFTATDACSNSVTSQASFTVEEKEDQYALTAQETKLVIELLGRINDMKQEAVELSFIHAPWAKEPVLKQFTLLDSLKEKVYKKTQYPKTGSLAAIAGTPLLGSLMRTIDSLLMLLSTVHTWEKFRFVESEPDAAMAELPANAAFKAINFQDFSATRSIAAAAQSAAGGFRYKEFDFNPPSKMPGSKFVFFSATNDKQKAIEKADEKGTRGGVFTKALVEIYKNNPVSITPEMVFEKIMKIFKEKKIVQTPSLMVAESRKKQSLFGIKNQQ